MPAPLRVLILEDHPADAELMLHELRQAGFAPDWQVVYAEADYLAHLHPDLDLILSDYAMPQFNALRALRLLQARGWDVPFVVVTGTISEEAAVECMLEGAADYLLKDRLARLGPAVTRALQAKSLHDEKRGAETALRKSEARYRLISELTSDYAYAFQVQSDGELTLEWVSGAFERITGYTSEEVDARGGWASLAHPDDRLLVRRRVQVLVSGRPDVSEFRIVTRTGEVRWLHDYGRPEWDDAQRRVVRFYGAVQDITERKRAEEALAHYAAETAVLYRASAQLLQSGGVAGLAEQIARAVTQEFNLCDCGVLLVVERENGPELTQTARTGDFQVTLNADLSLGGPGLMPAAVHAGKMLYAPDAPTDPRTIALDHRTRSELVVPLRVGDRILGVLDLQSPEPDAFPERMRRMVAAFAERAALALENAQLLERLELARQIAEEANQLKSEFLANTSHELRTPLTAILGALSIIMDGLCDTPDEEREFLKIAQLSSQRLLSIVNAVLDVAKIEAGKMEVLAESLDVAPVFEDVYSLTRVQADDKKLRLELLPPQATIPVYADPDKLRQILLNLVGNAIKFTERGSVTVHAQPDVESSQMIIEVRDTGIGIPLEKQSKLFQPFVQADGSMTRKHGGTGLGLSISRRLAEMMAGTLTLHSAGEGQGCVFTLALPLADASLNQPGEAQP